MSFLQDGHGTHSRYSAGCRCELCRDGHRIYAAERRRQVAYHGPLLHSATPAREILLRLTTPQATITEIAAASGIAAETLNDIRAGRAGRIRATTREALAAYVSTLPSEIPEEESA